MNPFPVLLSTLRLQMKSSYARPMFRFCLIANPIANTILLYEMFRASGQENFATYVILGAGLMGLWSCICFSSAGDIHRERYSGTLSLIYAAPGGFSPIILGKVLGNTLLSLFTFALSFLSAFILYGAKPHIASLGYLSLSLFSAILCFIVLSVLIAYLLTLSRKTTLYMNCIEIPIIFLCGFLFPVERLPGWILPLSYAMPPTWAVKLLRMSVAGITDGRAFFQIFLLLYALTAAYALLSHGLCRMIDRQVRIRGTLEVS